MILALAIATAGCDGIALPGVSTAPDVIQPGIGVLIGRDGDLVRRRSTSARSLVIGRDYVLQTGHCGVDMPMDFDGSFWVPVGNPGNKDAFAGVVGIFRLENEVSATFAIESGASIRLGRAFEHSFHACR